MNNNMIKAYGDTMDDGVVQLSFTLPIEHSARSIKAAEQYVKNLNFSEVSVSHAKKIADGFTYFVVYAKTQSAIDYSKISASEVETKTYSFYEINGLIKEKLQRPLIIVGATIGDDAHTVGIDAIMNMKGYSGDYGLERYPEIKAYNLGAQIPPEIFLQKAQELKADALLVSQTVTQKDSHLRNFTALTDLMESVGVRKDFILLAGGPRVTNDLAIELGYDAGFGPGTLPSHVASFVMTKLLLKKGIRI